MHAYKIDNAIIFRSKKLKSGFDKYFGRIHDNDIRSWPKESGDKLILDTAAKEAASPPTKKEAARARILGKIAEVRRTQRIANYDPIKLESTHIAALENMTDEELDNADIEL